MQYPNISSETSLKNNVDNLAQTKQEGELKLFKVSEIIKEQPSIDKMTSEQLTEYCHQHWQMWIESVVELKKLKQSQIKHKSNPAQLNQPKSSSDLQLEQQQKYQNIYMYSPQSMNQPYMVGCMPPQFMKNQPNFMNLKDKYQGINPNNNYNDFQNKQSYNEKNSLDIEKIKKQLNEKGTNSFPFPSFDKQINPNGISQSHMNFGQSNSLMNPINLGQNNVMGLTQNPMSFGQSMTMNMNQHNLMNMGQSMSMNPNTGISQNASMMQNIGGNIYPELKQWSGHQVKK